MDKILPFFVGKRTEILAVVYAVLQLLVSAGVLSPESISPMTDVIAPLGVATFAAKLGRK